MKERRELIEQCQLTHAKEILEESGYPMRFVDLGKGDNQDLYLVHSESGLRPSEFLSVKEVKRLRREVRRRTVRDLRGGKARIISGVAK